MPEMRTHVASGKVREIYALDEERLLLVASDRISTFDVVLPTEIPHKGRVLTGLSRVLVRAARATIVPNHMLAMRDGRAFDGVQAARDAADRVRRPRLPRGSGWKDYQETGRLCGQRARGAARVGKLPAPIFTPATKAKRATTRTSRATQAAELVGDDLPREVSASRSRSNVAAEHARQRGIIIADTKFEFGIDDDGNARSSTRP